MANRLEQEFPQIAWQVAPPLGPDGLRAEVIREHLAHGRRLRSRAIRNGARPAGRAVARVLLVVVALVRCAGHDLIKRPPERDCWARAAPGP